jgi:hypothetical protein
MQVAVSTWFYLEDVLVGTFALTELAPQARYLLVFHLDLLRGTKDIAGRHAAPKQTRAPNHQIYSNISQTDRIEDRVKCGLGLFKCGHAQPCYLKKKKILRVCACCRLLAVLWSVRFWLLRRPFPWACCVRYFCLFVELPSRRAKGEAGNATREWLGMG